jgi:dephospho-CoA kinase
MKPLVIGLTGPIGSGKSHVRSVLVSLGAEGIDADRVAHEVMAPDGPAYPGIVAEFGPAILGAEGLVDRGLLGARVFGDSAALARLEAIVHPAVGQAIRARVEASTAPLVVIEAIKLLEAGLARSLCDQVWVALCTRRHQFARLKVSRGMSTAEVRIRLANQMAPAQMAAQAHRVIRTDGTNAETAQAVLAAWVELGLPLPGPVIRTCPPSGAVAIPSAARYGHLDAPMHIASASACFHGILSPCTLLESYLHSSCRGARRLRKI